VAFTYDLSTDAGKVRLLIPDRNAADYVFEDTEIAAFLTIEGDIRNATALGLETIASDNAMVLKVIRLLDLTTDGAKTSDALLKRAAMLRDQADALDATGAFDYAEMVYNPFSERELLWKEALRGG